SARQAGLDPSRAQAIAEMPRLPTAAAFGLLLLLLGPRLQAATSQSSEDATAAVNLAADYILRTDLFKALAEVDLPAEISLPGFIKIVNLHVAGLDNVSRSCSLQLKPLGGSLAEAKTCVHIRSVRGAFQVKLLGQPLVFVKIHIADFRARVTLQADLSPGGAISLNYFDAWLSPIQVTNNGLVGDLVSKALQVEAVREQIRLTVADQLGQKIREALKSVALPA
ncbi:hypothetical protein BOX15_Mlig023724g2, partial [Macrostomum lignano]